MKYTYRGVNYEKEPLMIECEIGEVGGKYRGQTWNHNYPRHIPHIKPKILMQYRGVAYSTASNFKAEVSSEEKTEAYCPVAIKKPHKVYNETTQLHLDNIRRNLERRISVAKSKGDLYLISLLEKERQDLSLNH